MSINAINGVFALPRKIVSMKERLLLLVLANHVNRDTGKVFISVATMADECGTFPSTIRPILHRLEAKGVIVEVAPAGRYRPRTFRLNLPAQGSDFPDGLLDTKAPTSPTASVDQGVGKCEIKASGNGDQGVGKCTIKAPTSPTPIRSDPVDPSTNPRAREGACSQERAPRAESRGPENDPEGQVAGSCNLPGQIASELAKLAAKRMPTPKRQSDASALLAYNKLKAQLGALSPVPINSRPVADSPAQCSCGRMIVRRPGAGDLERLDYDLSTGRVGGPHACRSARQSERHLSDADSRSPAEERLTEVYVRAAEALAQAENEASARRADLHVVGKASDA